MHIECVRESGRPQGELSEKSYKWLDLLGLLGLCTRSVKSGYPCNPNQASGIKVGKTQIGLDPD